MQRVVFTPEGPWMGEGVGALTTSMNTFVGGDHQNAQSAGNEGHEGKKHGHGIKAFLHKIKDEL